MLLLTARRISGRLGRRFNSTASQPKSHHASLYSETFPAMVPIFLLGSAVYLGLKLAQMKLSQERYLQDADSHVASLESEIAALEEKRQHTSTVSTPVLVSEPTTPRSSSWRFW
ncbi:hypothetical protein FA15DRAFT_664213 [Coprinopsis marcescibilis]|uniref:Uncharacterized protein n=1 Tax=Coprinopsis marcescibilis TaxID=230819 RepID=A0A5C3L9F3_COPMA|nr:hypothetical protein FA15DRAFT_664213 [Coprinopsis marcescibilis]